MRRRRHVSEPGFGRSHRPRRALAEWPHLASGSAFVSIATAGPTATVFNQSYAASSPAPRASLPAGLHRIVIVGGGSAGWMTAMLLQHALGMHGVEIEVLES